MDHPVRYPCYSVDTSALIWLEDEMPPDVFPSMWAHVRNMASGGQLLISEIVRDECRRVHEGLDQFFADCPSAIVDFGPLAAHFAAYQAESPQRGTKLTRPSDTRDKADPYVVSLALAAEDRHLDDLVTQASTERTCTVVTYEGVRGGLKQIPNVCRLYGLRCVKWPDVMRDNAYSI
jgi:hypothetical protein